MLARLSLARIVLPIFVILTPGMIPGSEGQAILSADNGGRATQTPLASSSLLPAQGRKQPSYQVFAVRSTTPSIDVVNETTLEVAGKQKIDVSRLDQLTRQERETLASQFGVPIGVVENQLENFSRQAPTNAVEVASKLRVMMIDYKYLLERWNQYHPPAGQEKVKTDALLALQAGGLETAWAIYADLPRPKPPTGFRVAE